MTIPRTSGQLAEALVGSESLSAPSAFENSVTL